MNIIDIGIVIFILFGALIGFKRGFTKQLIKTVGFILVVIISFKIKNPVSEILFQTLPFFKFGGILKGVTVLNILLYEIIAFLLVLSLLSIGLKFLLLASSIFETLLNMTIVLGIPSKILGAIIGLLQHFIIVFIILYLLMLPIFDTSIVNESKYKDKILNKTPVLSTLVSKSFKVTEEFKELKLKYEDTTSPDQFNLDALRLMLEYKIVNVKSVDKLVNKDKLQINNIESVLRIYR